MSNFLHKPYVLAILAGLLSGIAVLHVVFPLAWIGLVPLFLLFKWEKSGINIWSGAVFGMTASLVTFVPLVSSISSFTGGGLLISLAILLIAALAYALIFGLLILSMQLVFRLFKGFPVLTGLALASTWTLMEFILNLPLDGMPWFGGHLGNGLTGNFYAIQTAEFFGDHGLTFIMVFVNFLLAEALSPLQWKKFILPVVLIAAWLGLGALVSLSFEHRIEPSKEPFRLAILSENAPPELKWDDRTGNALVSQFLELNKSAARLKPDMILWSESAIPWTFGLNDDFVREIRAVSDPLGITQLLGINTEAGENSVYNSIYCLAPGREIVRYDKSMALDIIEKPVAGMEMPFFSDNGTMMAEGENPVPLTTPYGKAGVMICSESFIWKTAAKMHKEGAEFFVHPSNDGWYRKTAIVRQHFYVARLRAVETRKDMAANSNLGLSGLIQASGKILKQKRDARPFVDVVVVAPNSNTTFYTAHPYLWIYLFVAILLVSVVIGSRYGILKGKMDETKM